MVERTGQMTSRVAIGCAGIAALGVAFERVSSATLESGDGANIGGGAALLVATVAAVVGLFAAWKVLASRVGVGSRVWRCFACVSAVVLALGACWLGIDLARTHGAGWFAWVCVVALGLAAIATGLLARRA